MPITGLYIETLPNINNIKSHFSAWYIAIKTEQLSLVSQEGFRKFYWDSTTVADHTRLAIVVVYTAMGLALFGLTFLVGRVVFTYLFRALLSLVNW